MHILLTRPLEDCSEMILKFKSLGHQVSHLPLLTIEKMKYEDGKEYPVFKIETSSESHPFYTGKGRIETKEGRVAKFRKKYSSK